MLIKILLEPAGSITMFRRLTIISISLVLILYGCATVPTIKEAFPTYNINGTTYFPLVSICEQRNINWEYDTFTRALDISKGNHKINLRVGDSLALVDGKAQNLHDPVDIYQGTIVVPSKFKEEILDTLFKESFPVTKMTFPVASIKKVVIDAGHGGNDPGAIGNTGLREKDVNLDIAKRLANLLRQQGIEVVMTRSTDKFIPLDKRVDIANASGADLFVSIHANANRVRSLKGFEVYYVAPTVSDSKRATSAADSASLPLDSSTLASHSKNVKTIIWDMIYTYNRAESIELSKAICHAMDSKVECPIIGIKGARFEVLRGVRMPGVLIETGFVSNPSEERMLKNSFYRQKITEGIMQGLSSYVQDLMLSQIRNP